MLVSIVTVYYNRENHVIESIESLLSQTYKNIEIIAIDDGSTDNTLDKLMSINNERLKVYTHENKGFVRSVIDAVNYANGEFIAIHGSGDISLPSRIEKQVELLMSDKGIGLVGCNVEHINKVTGDKRQHIPKIINGNTTETLLKEIIYIHGEVMFRRSVYDRVGGYRTYFKFSQDLDLFLRMSLITKFGIVPEVLYTRFTLPGGVDASYNKKIMQQYLAEVSRQSIVMKSNGELDMIEKYGEQAGFFLKRTKRLSDKIWKIAKLAYLNGDFEEAIRINKQTIEVKFNFKYVSTLILFKLLIKLPRLNNLFWKLLIKQKNYKIA